jgi:isopenicillin N synthase-like dioxygenase
MTATELPQQTIPLVDFGQFLNGSKTDKKKIAEGIDSAFRNVGFVCLQNHCVPQQKVDGCFEWVSISLLLQPHAVLM